MNFVKTGALAVLLTAAWGNAGAGGFYAGARAGIMDMEINDFDNAQNASVLLGYEFSTRIPLRPAIETEFSTSYSDGDIRVSGLSADWDIDTRALYIAARFGERLYGKVRAGVLNEEVSTGVGAFSVDGSETGISYSIGVGWRATARVSLEAEYTMVEQQVNFLSAGVNFAF